jgi:hypothetical protein
VSLRGFGLVGDGGYTLGIVVCTQLAGTERLTARLYGVGD